MYAGCYLAAMYAGCYLAARQYRESQQLSESRAELGTQAPDAEAQKIVIECLRRQLEEQQGKTWPTPRSRRVRSNRRGPVMNLQGRCCKEMQWAVDAVR